MAFGPQGHPNTQRARTGLPNRTELQSETQDMHTINRPSMHPLHQSVCTTLLVLSLVLAVPALSQVAHDEPDPMPLQTPAASDESTNTETMAEAIEDRVLVQAQFRQTELDALVGSATLIDSATLQSREATHLEDVLSMAPNVNFASGASRGRFFQIRGIGGRSQFVEPINASVGLLIDGIDLTGLGGAATTLDIQQIDILRGPQGTLFGANALGGMIYMTSNSTTEVPEQSLKLSVGNYNTQTIEGVISGPIGERMQARLATSHHRSNGFQRNAFLATKDTAGLDETTLRAKLRWSISDRLSLDLTGLVLDVDNGYDAFSLDNTRQTLSDRPGFDRQQSVAGSARWQWRGDRVNWEASLSHVHADLDYGYDEDWAFDGLCEVFECLASGYNSFDRYQRQNSNTTVDVRALSFMDGAFDWVVGVFAKSQRQMLDRRYTYASDFASDYGTEHAALYGQIDHALSSQWRISVGVRGEHHQADYQDNQQARFERSEFAMGGHISLERQLTDQWRLYGLISKGYKVGGFNPDQDIPESQRRYQTESLWNHELGLMGRTQDGRLTWRSAVFFQDRRNIQTQQSLVIPIEGLGCPCEFIEFQSNAAKGDGFGLELAFSWQVTERLEAFGSLGLLDAQFRDFVSYSHVDADDETGVGVDLSGRDIPQAPNAMASIGAHFAIDDHWYWRADLEAKDGFFFSSRHNTRADAYAMAHLRLGYQTRRWDIAFWVDNLFDKTVKTRGFGGFGNDPRKGYATEAYYQFGPPRTFGLSAGIRF